MAVAKWRRPVGLAIFAGLTFGASTAVEADGRSERSEILRWPALACERQDLHCPARVRLGFTYPFPREPGSYLFLDGVVYPYADVTADLLGGSRVLMPDGSTMTVRQLLHSFGLEEEMFERQIPVIGYGSNPSPEQLTRKFLVEEFDGVPVIPVMKGQIQDYDVVFAPHFVSYGAMPATIAPQPGTNAEIWVTWLDRTELDLMNRSEGTGHLYAYGDLSATWEVEGPDPETMKVYVDCFGALEIDGRLLALSAVPATGRTARAVSGVEALEAVLPTLDWHRSLFDLLLTNIASKRVRDRRTRHIAGLGVPLSDPNFIPEIPCPTPPEQPSGGAS